MDVQCQQGLVIIGAEELNEGILLQQLVESEAWFKFLLELGLLLTSVLLHNQIYADRFKLKQQLCTRLQNKYTTRK